MADVYFPMPEGLERKIEELSSLVDGFKKEAQTAVDKVAEDATDFLFKEMRVEATQLHVSTDGGEVDDVWFRPEAWTEGNWEGMNDLECRPIGSSLFELLEEMIDTDDEVDHQMTAAVLRRLADRIEASGKSGN